MYCIPHRRTVIRYALIFLIASSTKATKPIATVTKKYISRKSEKIPRAYKIKTVITVRYESVTAPIGVIMEYSSPPNRSSWVLMKSIVRRTPNSLASPLLLIWFTTRLFNSHHHGNMSVCLWFRFHSPLSRRAKRSKKWEKEIYDTESSRWSYRATFRQAWRFKESE